MAGSLNHIVAEDGSFTMDTIENMGDAHEALEDCHKIIAWLLAASGVGAWLLLEEACSAVRSPMPRAVPRVSGPTSQGIASAPTLRIVYVDRGTVPGVGKVWCFRHAVARALDEDEDMDAKLTHGTFTCVDCAQEPA